MEAYRKYLSPQVVSRLARMDLRARLVVEGFLTGLHESPYHGFSVEFAEHRPYGPGDPIRFIDWKVWGRTDRYYIKEYVEETNLKAYLLMDISASMGYSSNGLSKLEYGTYLAAALSYLMLSQQDAVGLLVFDEVIRKYLPPKSVMGYLHPLLTELDGLKPGRGTDVSRVLHHLAERIKRRGLIILISDLFDDPERVMTGLKHFRHKKHEVIVFHVLDPQERGFDFKRDGVFVDLETGERLTVQPWHIKRAYRELMGTFADWYKRECRQHRIDYVLLDTATDYDVALVQYLTKRKRIM